MPVITPDTPNWTEHTIDILDQGGIVLHPTDTAYGLAVDALNPTAIEKLNQLCQRDDKPYIMVVRDKQHATKYVQLSDLAHQLIDEFFPGALTLVLPKTSLVPGLLTINSPTVAIRQPKHPITHAISVSYPHPYTSTSANIAGGSTPYTVQDALDQLNESFIDLVIDIGELPFTHTSTVLDLTQTPPKILRQGAIPTTRIARYVL